MVETEDDAVAAAKRLGFPCVIKPLDGNHGRGVALDLKDEDAVRAAWPETRRQIRGTATSSSRPTSTARTTGSS